MKKIMYLVVAFVLLCGCSESFDQTEDPDTTGSIYGVVNDKNTGEPVRSASIELGLAGVWNSNGTPYRPTILNRTVTGNDGQYEFQNVDAGSSYYVKVTKTNFVDQYYRLAVQAGKVAKGDVLLIPFYVKIYGTVYEGNRVSVGNTVWLRDRNSPTYPILKSQSGTYGYYEFQVFNGRYSVEAYPSKGGSYTSVDVDVLDGKDKRVDIHIP